LLLDPCFQYKRIDDCVYECEWNFLNSRCEIYECTRIGRESLNKSCPSGCIKDRIDGWYSFTSFYLFYCLLGVQLTFAMCLLVESVLLIVIKVLVKVTIVFEIIILMITLAILDVS
jgi:hypothetical protein